MMSIFTGMGRAEQRKRKSYCSVYLGAGVPNICEEENVPLVAWVENACIPMVGGNGLGMRLTVGAACKLICVVILAGECTSPGSASTHTPACMPRLMISPIHRMVQVARRS